MKEKKEINKYWDRQYAKKDLDNVLLSILNYNEAHKLSITRSSFGNKNRESFETYYFKCRYIKSFGYITINEFRDDDEEVENFDVINLSLFEIHLTELGFRFIADGGFVGYQIRVDSEKRELKRDQIITRVIAIVAISVSIASILTTCATQKRAINIPIKDNDTIIIRNK